MKANRLIFIGGNYLTAIDITCTYIAIFIHIKDPCNSLFFAKPNKRVISGQWD